MSIENEVKLSEVSDLQRDLDKIALVEGLEEEGIHAHSLLKADNKMPGALLLETIDRAIHQKIGTPQESTFAQRNRIISRRQSRITAQRLFRPR